VSATRRAIGVVTVSRSDYGHLVPLLERIRSSPQLELQLFVCGSHLSERFGRTVAAIEADGWPIAERIATCGGRARGGGDRGRDQRGRARGRFSHRARGSGWRRGGARGLVMDLRDPWSLVERVPEAHASPLRMRRAASREARAVARAALIFESRSAPLTRCPARLSAVSMA